MPPPPSAVTGSWRVPPPPPPPRRDDGAQALALAQSEVRDLQRELHHAREQAKRRDTQLAELRTTLAERNISIEHLRAQLSQLTAALPQGDDLQRIRGIGPGYQSALKEAGVTSFAAIAAWDDQQLVKMAAVLKTHPTRIQHGQWVEQARALARV